MKEKSNCTFLDKTKAGLFLIDIQEKLFPEVDHSNEVLYHLNKLVTGCRILGLPIFVSEQYPKGLGHTIEPIKKCLPQDQKVYEKTVFSCGKQKAIMNDLDALPVSQWILAGIEAHVCVLQTAKDLTQKGKEVIVVNDAISSRSVYDFSTAIAEMKEFARITSTETVLFELIQDASAPEFKECIHLFKKTEEPPSSCGCSDW